MRLSRAFRIGLTCIVALELMIPSPVATARGEVQSSDADIEVIAEGLSEPRGLGKDGSLYVLEIAHNSLLAPLPEGAVVKVAQNGDREIIADGLFFPGGLALGKSDELYVRTVASASTTARSFASPCRMGALRDKYRAPTIVG